MRTMDSFPANTPVEIPVVHANFRHGALSCRATWAALGAALLMSFAGCSSINTTPTRIANDVLPTSAIIPNYRIPVSPSVSIPFEALIAAAIVFWYVDPLGPNWEVEERQLSPSLIHLSLRKKRYATGGDGEAPQIIRRRATELAIKAGIGNYQVVEYAEGVESETLGARRVTTALVRLTPERAHRIP